MNSKKQTLAYGALIAMAAALTGCSGGPSKGDLKDGLAAYR